MMNLTFKRKPYKDECNSITDILYDEKNGRVQRYLADFFGFDLQSIYAVDKQTGYELVSAALKDIYESNKSIIDERISLFECKWKECQRDIFDILKDIFECRIDSEQSVTVEFTINAVCPRYLDRWAFDVNFRKSDEEIILTCIHEIIHFMWFEEWTRIFLHTDIEEFNAPNLPWLLSEIVIDAIIKETELKKYCVVDKPAYKHFYDIDIEGRNMIEYFRELFIQNDMEAFMKKGYEYVVKYRDNLY